MSQRLPALGALLRRRAPKVFARMKKVQGGEGRDAEGAVGQALFVMVRAANQATGTHLSACSVYWAVARGR